MRGLPPPIERVIVCPVCHGPLSPAASNIHCAACGIDWPQSRSDLVDLFLPGSPFEDRTGWEARQALMLEWYAETLGAEGHVEWLAADYEAIAHLLESYSGRVLDVGGGLGLARQFLPSATDYIVLDPCGEWLDLPLDRLARVLPAATARPPFVRGLGEHLPIRDRSFDVVLALWTLNHASRPAEVLREVCRVLRPGGHLLLVLEDIPLTVRDMAPSADGGTAPVSTRPESVNDRLIQADHVAVSEQQLWRWMAGLASPVRRERLGGHLVIEFAKQPSRPITEPRTPVRLGDLRRTRPVSTQFGFDRGLPVDRHYIEAFLRTNAQAIRGRVLEIGDDTYTWRYGGANVETSDVLHVSAGNPRATLVGDLANAPHLPSQRFDCIICTQTLQLIFDVRAALATLHRMLGPGGVLLATVPGISQIGLDEWRDDWCWSFTPVSAQRLLSEAFPSGDIEVEDFGNVLVATAFLHGLAADELSANELAEHDPAYPMVVTIKAVKSQSSGMRLIEVVTVDQHREHASILVGAHLDLPRPGDRAEAKALRIQGWVVGQVAASHVELLSDGVVRGRLPVALARPDVAAYLPHAGGAGRSGFSGAVDLGRVQGASVQVTVVFSDGGRIPVATIGIRPTWLEPAHPLEPDLVSVVIPCFNHAHFLGDAIESVLVQNYPNLEIVVVDDGSVDNAVEVAARYPSVRYVRQANRGLAGARNEGLRRTNGQFIIFLDADDKLTPGAVELNVGQLKGRPDCAFVYGEFRHINVDGTLMDEWQRPVVTGDPYAALLRGNHIGMHATVMYRRAVFQTVHGFDERLDASEDYDLFLRISRLFPICGHSQVVAEYRRHSASMSADLPKMLRASLSVLRSQRRFLKSDPIRRSAYLEGVRGWRRYYGQRILDHAVACAAGPGGFKSAARDLCALLRYAPMELLAALLPRIFVRGTRA